MSWFNKRHNIDNEADSQIDSAIDDTTEVLPDEMVAMDDIFGELDQEVVADTTTGVAESATISVNTSSTADLISQPIEHVNEPDEPPLAIPTEVASANNTTTPSQTRPPQTAHDDDARALPFTSSEQHLNFALHWVEQLLRAQTLRWRETIAANKPEEMWGMVLVTEQEVESILSRPFSAPGHTPEVLQQKLQPYWQNAAAIATELNEREYLSPVSELRLLKLCQCFQLSMLEQALLLLCLFPDMDARYRRLFGFLLDDASQARPTMELLLQCLSPLSQQLGEVRRALGPGGTLLQQHLLLASGDARSAESPALRTFRVDDRIIDYLLGGDQLDSRIASVVKRGGVKRGGSNKAGANKAGSKAAVTEQSHQTSWQDLIVAPEVADKLQKLVPSMAEPALSAPVLFFRGPYGSGKEEAAHCLANSLGQDIVIIDASQLMQAISTQDEWPLLVTLLCREARLGNALMYWRQCECLFDQEQGMGHWHHLVEAMQAHDGLVIFDSTQAWDPAGTFYQRRFVRMDFTLPGYALRCRSWQQQLAHLSLNTDLDIAQLSSVLANGFQLTHGQIADAIATAKSEALARDPDSKVKAEAKTQAKAQRVTLDDLYEGCRRQSSRSLVAFAQLIEPRTELSFDDLILPEVNKRQLDELRNRIRFRSQVFTGMGFEARLSLGRGLIALFTGASGTGKTMAAELLGREYGMQLYKVDLSAVVSKYVGETEKNLSKVFTEAEDANAILFFDEGEALFGKRGEVKDARDRWANIEVNYLLQRVEEFAGVVILTTNFRQNLDPAFLRRIHVIADFPKPDTEARLRIWQGMFPEGVSRPDDDTLRQLAEQFNLVGGNIKNAVLDAAFRALSDNSRQIELRHLVLGIAREQQKQGTALTKGDFGLPFYTWIENEIL